MKKKVTLGIILPGNPDRIQKPMRWLKILEYFFRYSWPLFLILAIYLRISPNYRDALYRLDALMVASISFCLWALGFGLFGEQKRCPYCKHFFTMRRISADQTIDIATRDITREVADHHTGIAYDLKGNSALVFSHSNRTEHGTETTETYVYHMRCKHCGCVNKVKGSKTRQSF